VRSHAKASTAGSTQRQATGLGRIFRGALATRGASHTSKGSGAPKARRMALPLALFAAILSLALWAGVASAVAPTIVSTSVSAVTSNTALLEAEVNPQGEATTYHFEYGLANCSSNPCTSAPVPNANVGSGSSAMKVTHEVEGLTPGTTYHFRVVATNGSGPSAGPDRTFTTYAALAPNTNCPNQAFRSGAAANLPDCRGYEMVSPVDKNGGAISTSTPFWGEGRGAYNQASLDGNKLTFSSGTSFAGNLSSRNVNQYIAARGASGWTTQGIDAPLSTMAPIYGFLSFETWLNTFKLFTPDLSTGWMTDQNAVPLTPDATVGQANLYRRDSLGGYQALTTGTAENVDTNVDYNPDVQGHSADFSHIAFSVPGKLTPDAAATTGLHQIYVHSDGELHLISVAPNGIAHRQGGTVGWVISAYETVASATHAVSDDGSLIYWTAGRAAGNTIYLRQNPDQPQSAMANGAATGTGNFTSGSTEVTGVTTSSGAFAVGQTIASEGIPRGTTIVAVGPSTLTLSAAVTNSFTTAPLESFSECTEAAKACTLQVSETQGFSNYTGPQFWTAAADGSKMFYTDGPTFAEEANLYEFDLASETSTLVAGKTSGVLGASDDASAIYFDSAEVLDAGATAGQPNLYLYRNGTFTFIGTLAPGDVGTASIEGPFPSVPTVNHGGSRGHASRVSPDGDHLVFESVSPSLAASLGYDNADAINGKPSMEVYRYDAEANGGAGQLSCVSCNPAGVRPVGEALRKSYFDTAFDNREDYYTSMWAAAWIQTWIHPMHHSNVLSEDGDRIYFNSFDALVPQDTNGAQDVYQWQAPGTGDCTQQSPSFSPLNEGCIGLISTGASADRSEFVDATPDGSSVFFETFSSIDPRDPGLVDIYVAREGGGFPLPTPSLACEGEGCQSAPPPPIDATPASASFKGAGNPAPRKARRACRGRKGNGAKAKRQAKRSKGQKRCRGAKRGTGR
jgi:hypothetical protein